MLDSGKGHARRVCPKTGRPIDSGRTYRWLRWLIPVAGLLSLLWFLIRVLPKPSRATYPCQRVAGPLAGGFLVWLTGALASLLAYRKARRLLGQSRYIVAGVFLSVAVAAVWCSISLTADSGARAAFSPSEPANSPMGRGRGIHPGRVVWVHEPEATHWDGQTGAWWDAANTRQDVVAEMVSRSLRTLTGQAGDAAAWEALFRHFNQSHDGTDAGYQPGEKVTIKINMNQDGGGTWGPRSGMPSPQMIYAVLDQLINVAGVPGEAITIYDASRFIGDPIYDTVRGNPDPNFQSVTFAVRPDLARRGRVGAVDDPAHPVLFAQPAIFGAARAHLPQCVTQARYLINLALLRAHSLFGVTLCGKNHFGSVRFPSWTGNRGWTPEPLHNYGARSNAMGTYNCLVDLIGHAHLGGKTLLYLIDGLYAARNQSAEMIRYESFADDWCSSLLVSQDPVAIDSVGLDFIRNEPRATDCTGPGVDNYLHEAAGADAPPSGTVYDPEGDGTPLASLGVHEHWNNPRDKQYARNLGAAEGIELVVPALTSADGPVENVTQSKRYDYIRHGVADANVGDELIAGPGLYRESIDLAGKTLTLRSADPNDPNVVAATVIDGGSYAVRIAGADANCVLAGLTLTGAGHGVYCSAASPTIVNCRIIDNVEAGVKLWEAGDPTLVNCIIAGNGGDGIEMWAARTTRRISFNYATVAHCTVVGNGGYGVFGGRPTIVNSILYANGFAGDIPQVEGETPDVTFCAIQGGFSGPGNIDVEPGFVVPGYWADPNEPNQPAGPETFEAVWVEGDYHLAAGSPCIDAGSGDGAVPWAATDIDGQRRPGGLGPDLGCDEAAP